MDVDKVVATMTILSSAQEELGRRRKECLRIATKQACEEEMEVALRAQLHSKLPKRWEPKKNWNVRSRSVFTYELTYNVRLNLHVDAERGIYKCVKSGADEDNIHSFWESTPGEFVERLTRVLLRYGSEKWIQNLIDKIEE